MKFRYFFLALLLVVIAVFTIAGFRGDHFQKPPFEIFPDMNYQDKVKDQVPSAFFADGNSARAPIPGTVAEEMPAQNDYWATGKWDDAHWGDGIPVHDSVDGGRALQVDAANMARGRERYTISCEVCHGAAGDGKGITSKYGLNGAASYHVDRLRKETDGEIFDTITNGKGQMFGYGYNITVDDRWRIVMYIRALQRGQNAMLADATPEEQAALDKTKKPPTPPPAAPAPAAPAPAPAPTPEATPAPGNAGAPPKPPGTAMNSKQTGKFSFDIGYQFDGTLPAAHVLAPATKMDDQLNRAVHTYVLTVNLSSPTAEDSHRLAMNFDVRAQVYDLATDVLLDLTIDTGGQWTQASDVVRFVPVKVTGPLRLDYGTPFRSIAKAAPSSGKFSFDVGHEF